jgi:hypothetical protein
VIAWGSVSRSSSVSAAVANDFGGQKATKRSTAAARAMAEGDVVEMMRAYQVLKEFKE